ncbi:glycosyltransferase family 2 protein [Pseudopedobacter beijingensis]|uniref:Glycosyltransferase family 2 protein n=1 Tax=Pseudopedobacter beijingensis TaxID=1207056 RepID=A0ABW4I778_9SPHI
MEKNSLNLPLVSICIPCYNAEQYIKDTLDCIGKQSYRNLEIIVIDDHSTDNSLNILQNYSQKYPFLQFETAQKKGAAAARNQAFTLSKGEFIVFFDADDIIEENFIESQLAALHYHKEDVVVSSWGRFSDHPDNCKTDPYIIEKDLSFYEWIIGYWTNVRHTTPPGRVMASRELTLKSGLWDEGLSLNDDFQFFSTLFYYAKTIIYNGNSVFKYRTGIGGLSTQKKGYEYQLSNFNALMKGIELAISKYPQHEVKKACANMLQNFIYECYPDSESLLKKAHKKTAILGGADFPFPSGGYTKMLVNILGWKLTKLLKLKLGKS